jgi:hypothetical protein
MIRHKLYILILILASGLRLAGQVEKMVIPSDLKQKTIVTEPSTLNRGFLRAGLSASFQSFDRLFDLNGDRGYLLNSNTWRKSWTYYCNIEYGLTDRIQLSLSQPFINGQTFISYNIIAGPVSEADTTISGRSKEQGFCDLTAGVSYQILKERERVPSITASINVTFPTGRKKMKNVIDQLEYNGPTGSGYYSLMVNVKSRKIFYPYSATFEATYLYTSRGKKELIAGQGEVEYNIFDELTFSGGFYAHLNDWIVVGNQLLFLKPVGEITFYYDPPSTGKPDSWVFSYDPEIFFQIRRFRFYEKTMIPLFGKDGSADPVYFIGLQYMF